MKSTFLRSASRLFVLVFCFFILAVLPMASTAQAAPVRSGKQLEKIIPQMPKCFPHNWGHLTLNPTSGDSFDANIPGTLITATGTGFYPYQPVTLWWPDSNSGQYYAIVSNIPTDGSGNLQSTTFNVPPYQYAQNYSVEAYGCYDLSYATVTVQALLECPAILVDPHWVKIGQLVTIRGCGFQPSAVVTITGGDGANGTVTADSSGNFTFTWRAPFHRYKYCYGVTATDAFSHTAFGGFCDAP